MTRQLSCPSTDTGWQDMFLTTLRQTGRRAIHIAELMREG